MSMTLAEYAALDPWWAIAPPLADPELVRLVVLKELLAEQSRLRKIEEAATAVACAYRHDMLWGDELGRLADLVLGPLDARDPELRLLDGDDG